MAWDVVALELDYLSTCVDDEEWKKVRGERTQPDQQKKKKIDFDLHVQKYKQHTHESFALRQTRSLRKAY